MARRATKRPGDVTITGRGQVSLPAGRMRELQWRPGDHLLVERVGNTLVLVRRPAAWADEVAGSFSELFGTTEENVALVRAERATWE
jgi:bifunctional DNA-binding transcriptional regulator/antitoxin component of YhaV-PrlF toxin-antitoxin module